MFDLGERVLCIKSGWGCPEGHPLQRQCCPNLPRRGRIYTIRWIERVIAVAADGPTWWVRLVEVVNPVNQRGEEPIFEAINFVPLKRTETDIDFAFEILRKSTGKVSVD